MANAFYLQNLVNQKGKSSIVEISTFTGKDTNSISFTLYGLLSGSIKASYKNKWEAAMPSLDTLSHVSQVFTESSNVISWLNGTSAAWGSTDPVRITVSFYKLTLNPSDNIRAEVGKLASLASLSGNTSGSEITNNFTVRVHNGYRNNFWNPNGQLMGLQTGYSPGKKGSDGKYETPDNLKKWEDKADLSQNEGTVTIKASGMKYSNMLLESIDIEPSRQMVAPNKPLFIKVDATFRGVRACITKDINECFGLNISDTGENVSTGGGGGSNDDTKSAFYTLGTNDRARVVGAYVSKYNMGNTAFVNGEVIDNSTIQKAIDWFDNEPFKFNEYHVIGGELEGNKVVKITHGKGLTFNDSTKAVFNEESIQAISRYNGE